MRAAAAATGAAAELMTVNSLFSVWLSIVTDNTAANYYCSVHTVLPLPAHRNAAAAAATAAADASLYQLQRLTYYVLQVLLVSSNLYAGLLPLQIVQATRTVHRLALYTK